jgi:hypothetical protein
VAAAVAVAVAEAAVVVVVACVVVVVVVVACAGAAVWAVGEASRTARRSAHREVAVGRVVPGPVEEAGPALALAAAAGPAEGLAWEQGEQAVDPAWEVVGRGKVGLVLIVPAPVRGGSAVVLESAIGPGSAVARGTVVGPGSAVVRASAIVPASTIVRGSAVVRASAIVPASTIVRGSAVAQGSPIGREPAIGLVAGDSRTAGRLVAETPRSTEVG